MGGAACEPCPVGSFQPRAKQTSCIMCPEGTTTFNKGSTFCKGLWVLKGKNYIISSLLQFARRANGVFSVRNPADHVNTELVIPNLENACAEVDGKERPVTRVSAKRIHA